MSVLHPIENKMQKLGQELKKKPVAFTLSFNFYSDFEKQCTLLLQQSLKCSCCIALLARSDLFKYINSQLYTINIS